MVINRYNRIVLPFIFLIDLTILLTLYFIFFSPIKQSTLFFVALFWVFPSIIFKSFQVPRTYSKIVGLIPMLYTFGLFILIYNLGILFGLLAAANSKVQFFFLTSAALLLFLSSLSRYLILYQFRLRGRNIRYAVLLNQNITDKGIEKLNGDAILLGYRFVKLIKTSERYFQELNNLIGRMKIDIVFIQGNNNKLTDSVSAFCDDHGLRMKILLPLSVSSGLRAGLDQIGGYPVMDLRHEPLLYLGNRIMKRTVDFLMASLSIVFILTWLPVVVKLVQAFSYPGPLFFVQERIGRDGKIFNLYKFRTMVYSKEEKSAKKGQAEKTHERDKRVPWFGRLLRRTNLDEYPQFLNVLFGFMSTVGPRPHMVGEDMVLEKKVPRYRVRRFVKPGITGWAAINGYRGGTDDIALMSKRTEHDIWYLENWTIWLDIKIMAITIWQMITLRIPRAY